MSTTTQHGATQPSDKGEIRDFSGTEGLLVANRLGKQIRLFLGTLDSEDFLTTPKEDLLNGIRSALEGQSSLIWKEEKALRERWSKCYWTIRALFKPGSTADSLFNPCDDSKDIPGLWNIFQKEYLGGENIHLAGSILEQLFDPSAIMPNPLDEFSRLFDLEKKLDALEQASTSSPDFPTSSPAKATVARTLSYETAAR